MSKVFGLIMAGGGGTRFWPLSTKKTPKQLLNLSGNNTLINETIGRFGNVISRDNLFIVTNKEQIPSMLDVTRDYFSPNNFIVEPEMRNTTACIGYSALRIYKQFGDGILVVSPSDAFVDDTSKFENTIFEAIQCVKNTSGIVTIGVKPHFPSTGYGYIRYDISNHLYKKVIEFVEKPDEKTAKQYYESGNYVWNAGIFVFKISTILKQMKMYCPKVFASLEEISEYIFTDLEEKMVDEIYHTIEPISIDYSIMEKADNIWMIEASFNWSDVGSWDAMGVFNKCDENSNILIGDSICLSSTNNIVYSKDKTIVLHSVSDLLVIEGEKVIFVCPKKESQSIKEVVSTLKNTKREDLL